MARIQAIRGMNDILPGQTAVWRYLEDTVRSVLDRYGFQEIRTPILEQTELFCRSIGEVTDIVEKEMYTFADRNGDSLTLRPEGTASCVRAGEEHGLLYNQTQRLWYRGPMFRHERPQKGRYRQFHQIGVECFGLRGPDIDAELLIMTARLWQRLGLSDHARLEINSLGTPDARRAYRDALVGYLEGFRSDLDLDSQKRLDSNPLRILDSKDGATREILANAPSLSDYLDEESRADFQRLQQLLTDAGVPFTVNPKLVRGLDYYSKTVFEWITESLGSQGTLCAGGRYDGLVEQLGGKSTPAVGFAMGLERLILMLEALDKVPASVKDSPDIYLVVGSEEAQSAAFQLAEQIRDALPDIRVLSHCGGGSFKSQFKRADRSGASVALILGDDEVASGTVVMKPLRSDKEQVSLKQSDLERTLSNYFSDI